jgi:hypothetical protein
MDPKKFFVGRAVGLLAVLALVGAVAALYVLGGGTRERRQPYVSNGYKDIEYVIEGRRIKLKNGIAETEAAPGSASKIITRYFGNELAADLNDDGREDVVFLLTEQSGGSGTMYYAVAALATDQGYVGSEGFLLGDRIAPQTTEKGSGKVVVVNYADRAPGESFSAAPSIARSRWLLLDSATNRFGEVEPGFEG